MPNYSNVSLHICLTVCVCFRKFTYFFVNFHTISVSFRIINVSFQINKMMALTSQDVRNDCSLHTAVRRTGND